MEVRLWVDDLRPAPAGWAHARSVRSAIAAMTAGGVVEASLDHDLGDFASEGGDGWRLVDWMAERGVWPSERITVHSANPVGTERMLATIDRYGPYKPGPSTRRSRWR